QAPPGPSGVLHRMAETPSQRLPPQSLEGEMSVLGGVLLENEALNRALEVLRPEDFYRDSHRKIFSTLIDLSEKNEPADLVTLTAALQQRGELEAVGGSSYLATLVDYVPTAANIVYYCRLVKEKATARQLIRVATEIATRGYECGDVEADLDWAEKSIFELAGSKLKSSYFSTR
ncbi:MAG: DnaB-like helicase N-terminal domain-containing protein, partial [Desulfuromonadaceae bacterium]